MHPDRRRAGRAIRKQHRLIRDATSPDGIAATIAKMNALAEAFAAAWHGIFALAAALAATTVDIVADRLREDRRANAQTFRMAHRALTAGGATQ